MLVTLERISAVYSLIWRYIINLVSQAFKQEGFAKNLYKCTINLI